jgi:voltage-gated potassium channel
MRETPESASPLSLKAKTYRLLYEDSSVSRALAALIVINLAAVVLETVESLRESAGGLFLAIEVFSVAVFTIEYVARVWSCTQTERYAHPIFGRLRYALTPVAVVDLLAILPFYLPLLIPVDLRFLRTLRLLRMIRILKLGRYSKSVHLVYRAMRETREQLGVVLVVIFFLMLVACSAMYFFENDAQPDQFSSIPATFWWGVMTLTTVGYGDVYPVTVAGRIVAALVAFLGIGLFALPAGIVSAEFIRLIAAAPEPSVCPHCGKAIES